MRAPGIDSVIFDMIAISCFALLFAMVYANVKGGGIDAAILAATDEEEDDE